MTCIREGCNQPCNVWAFYCSADCRSIQLELSARRVEAMFTDAEPPSMDDLMDERQRAKRWTPETMQEHINEIRQ